MRKLLKDNHGGMIGFLIMIMIVIIITVNLATDVAEEAITATENADVQAVPGGVAVAQLLPLLFLVIPVVYVANKLK